jgi:hypothetical protein
MTFHPLISDFIVSDGPPAEVESVETVDFDFAVNMFDHVMSEHDLEDHVRRFAVGDVVRPGREG